MPICSQQNRNNKREDDILINACQVDRLDKTELRRRTRKDIDEIFYLFYILMQFGRMKQIKTFNDFNLNEN